MKNNLGFFRSFYVSMLGVKCWYYLNTPDMLKKMIQAVNDKRPPVEYVELGLFQSFGNSTKIDYYKRAIGHMIKLIMENLGYKLKSRANIKNGIIFGSGSLYEK